MRLERHTLDGGVGLGTDGTDCLYAIRSMSGDTVGQSTVMCVLARSGMWRHSERGRRLWMTVCGSIMCGQDYEMRAEIDAERVASLLDLCDSVLLMVIMPWNVLVVESAGRPCA